MASGHFRALSGFMALGFPGLGSTPKQNENRSKHTSNKEARADLSSLVIRTLKLPRFGFACELRNGRSELHLQFLHPETRHRPEPFKFCKAVRQPPKLDRGRFSGVSESRLHTRFDMIDILTVHRKRSDSGHYIVAGSPRLRTLECKTQELSPPSMES